MKKPFRVAWITEPGYDFSAVEKYCEEVRFLTKGYEKDTMKMADSIHSSLADFNLSQDVIVPVGKVLSVWLVALSVNALQENEGTLNYAVYQGGDYSFRKWNLQKGLHEEVAEPLEVAEGA